MLKFTDVPPSTQVIMTGFGQTSSNEATLSKTLKNIFLKTISITKCSEKLKSIVSISSMCTDNAVGQSYSTGDFREPLVIADTKEQIGIAGKSAQGDPDVYTKSSPYLKWIFTTAGRLVYLRKMAAGCSYLIDHPDPKPDSEGWVEVGKLKDIINYPIDTGFGFNNKDEAYIAPFGLETTNFARVRAFPFPLFHLKMYDRCLIAFRNKEAILYDPKLLKIDDANIITDLMAKIRCRERAYSQIKYLGESIVVVNVDSSMALNNANIANGAIQDWPWDFGSFSQEDRYVEFRPLTHSYAPQVKKNKYLANYSSFTLINSASLEALQAEIGTPNLCTNDFYPHLVIDAYPPYCEENMSHLKIGHEVEFGNIIPCTHSFNKIDEMGNRCQDRLFNKLLRNHSVNARYPRNRESSWLPTFGINMQSVNVGNIAVGEKVYAKVFEQAN